MTGLRATLRFLRCTVPFTALLACPAVVPAPAHAQQDDSALPAAAKAPAMTYRGFTVDDSAVQADGLAELRSTMRQQLDMVLAVGLAPEVVAFLQAVPVVVHPAGSFARPSAGRYVGRARQVEVTEDLVLRRHRPVLARAARSTGARSRAERSVRRMGMSMVSVSSSQAPRAGPRKGRTSWPAAPSARAGPPAASRG